MRSRPIRRRSACLKARTQTLGAAPVYVKAINGNAWVVVADSTPSLAAGGVLLTPMGPNVPITFQQADASSHVYALATSGPATVAYTAIYAASLGSSVSVIGPLGVGSTAAQGVSVSPAGTDTSGQSLAGTGFQGYLATILNKLDTLNTTAGNPLAAGSNVIGKVGIDQTTPGTTNLVQLPTSQISTLTPPTSVAPIASAAGGASNYGPIYSAANTNTAFVKASPGNVYSITVTQSTTTAMELKLYNSTTAPTCSSATGIIDNIPIPSNATSPGFHLTFPVGRYFSTGIAYCIVAFGAPASSTDTGNAATGVTLSMTYD